MSDIPGLWYLNRATGLILLVLLTLTVVLGILTSSSGQARHPPRWWPRFATAELHANLAVLSVSTLVAHIVTAVVDGFVPITWIDAFVPFRSAYRPLWLGLGSLASDLLLAVVLASIARHGLGLALWRRSHLLVYPLWPLAVLHGLGTGSDTPRLPVLALTFACVGAVAVSVVARFTVREGSLTTRWAVRLTAMAMPLALGFWLAAPSGPLHPGWAERAGSPTSGGEQQ